MKILIVDESKEIRDRILRLINANNKFTKVIQAENLAEAKSMIYSEAPEVLLIDLRFSDGNTFDLLDSIDKSTYAPIIIILTNYDQPFYREKAAEMGASFFFNKSTEFLDLRYTLQNFISKDNGYFF
ncbi:MAG: response regulator [Bacteroidota bacterium]